MSDICNECACDNRITAELHLIEYIDKDGVIWWEDLSSDGQGGTIGPGKMFELVGRAQLASLAPYFEDMIHDAVCGCDEDGDEDPDLAEV